MKYTISVPGFTLVELIVVITIVGILSTIGFVSYSNYLSGARDSNRISQMVKLSDALQVYASKNTLPLPDDKVDITASGMIIAYQGYLGTQVLETIDYSNGGLDPKDDLPYTYMVSKDRKSLQLLALMEEPQNITALITQSYAANYENRYPKVYGQKLGVLTDTNNTPLQELNLTGSTLNVLTTPLILTSYLTDSEYVTGTGGKLTPLQNLVPQRGKFWTVENNTFVYSAPEELAGSGTTTPPSNRYPGCDTDDITVGGYTIAACNVGATTASTNWLVSRGNYFQWGRNKGFTYGDMSQQSSQIAGSVGLNASTDNVGFVWSSSLPSPYTWANTDITNNWGDTTNTNTARQGPCAPGYRVPSLADWQGIVTAGGWGTTQGAAMQTALQLPYAGFRDWNDGAWYDGGSFGYYWSSSPSGAYGRGLIFYATSINPASSGNRAYGFSLRCFKN